MRTSRDEGPQGATMDPVEALLPEHRRICLACGGAVGRARGGRPGRLRGVCPWCGAAFDLTPHLAVDDVLTGRRGGRWRVAGPLARGGHSWLHAATDERTGRSGVLSRTRGPAGPEAGDVALDEPEVLLALDHPGLVRVRDVVDGPGAQRHLVLDRVHGTGCGEAAGLCLLDVARVALGVLPALAHLHGLGLLHADLTPDHLVVTPDPAVVLLDLGSVRRVVDRTSPVWTTEGYTAPEIVPGGAGPSPASDVFALGRVLSVLAVGSGTGPGGRGAVTGPWRAPRLPDHKGLARLVATTTDPDPARRPDLGALAAALREVLADGAAPPEDPGHRRRDDAPAPHRLRRRPACGGADARGATIT